MGFDNSSSDDEVISGINVTPLVDVVLVLLIIFLITAPMIYQTSIKVHLAQASTGEATDTQQLSIAVTNIGDLSWNGEPVSWQGLDRHLKDLGNQISQKTAIISADRETPNGIVVELMDALRSQGLTHLALSVEKAQSKTHD